MPRVYKKKTHCIRGHELTPENRVAGKGQCRQCRKIHMATAKQKDPDYRKKWRSRHKTRIRHQHLQQKYGVSGETYENMVAQQQNRCAICKKIFDDKSWVTDAYVDHDHEAGKVRDLLCKGCNTGLGCFADDVEVAQAAFEYLARHKNEGLISAVYHTEKD